ncbi:histone acetyltransferase KAT6B [Polyodon spathula]|uniref:histone acetyltransferase KAT6B n=1 Tax=Polyodon spathula TaxID=7913 RepID=UPI001B7E99DE|nr:histone acetyltransferase KAT6B [Polyodon spathula]XP_041123421.1 histone acetyltransferase KAT6B [Polyodon spathula]
MNSPDEDVSVRTLLKAVMSTEPDQTPVRVTRRQTKLESGHSKRRSARLQRLDIGLMSPSLALRSKQKQKILQSGIKSPQPGRTKRTSKGNKPLICPGVLGNQEDLDEFTPRGLLRKIILTQPDSSLVIPNRPVRDDDHEQASSPGASRPSTETFNVDLPDLSTGNITAFVKGISRKRPKKKISVTVFEKDMEAMPLQVAENQQQEPTESISVLSAGTASFSSFNLSLKTPVEEEDPKNHGLRRRAPKRKAISIEDFEEGVQNYLHKKMAGLEKSCVDPQKVLCETPGMEKFTLGLSAALPPDLTGIAFNNTELFEPPFFKSPNLAGRNTPAVHTASLHSITGADSIEEEEEEGVRRPSEVGMEREKEEGEGVRQPSEVWMEVEEKEVDEKVDVADGQEEGEEKVDDTEEDKEPETDREVTHEKNENQTEAEEEEEEQQQEVVIDDNEDEEVAEEREVGEEEERESVLGEPENMETEHTERTAVRSQIEVKEMDVDSMHRGKEYSGIFTGNRGDLVKVFESPAASRQIDRQPESAVHIFQHAEQRRASQTGGPTYSVNDPTNTTSLNQMQFTPVVEPSTPFAPEASESGRSSAPGTPRESERLSSPPSGGAPAQETPQTSAGGALGAEEEEEEDEEDEASDGAESVELSLKTPAFLRTKKSAETPASSLSTPVFLKGKVTSKSLPSAEKAKKPQQKKNKVVKADKATGLPKSLVTSVFSHFAKTTVSRDTYPILQQCLDKYFDRLSDDLEAYARHAKRKTIELADVELLLRRQGFVSDKMPLKVLIERHLPMEYRKLLIPVATSGNRVIPKM